MEGDFPEKIIGKTPNIIFCMGIFIEKCSFWALKLIEKCSHRE